MLTNFIRSFPLIQQIALNERCVTGLLRNDNARTISTKNALACREIASILLRKQRKQSIHGSTCSSQYTSHTWFRSFTISPTLNSGLAFTVGHRALRHPSNSCIIPNLSELAATTGESAAQCQRFDTCLSGSRNSVTQLHPTRSFFFSVT